MASLVALGAEVFLLKAEIERLRRALETAGTLAPKQLESAASDAAFKAWLDSEQSVFARHLLDPLWRAEAAANTAPNSEPVVPSPADAGAASRGDTA